MRIWSSEHVFEHSWDTVVHAAWRKYPNPLKPEVVALDVIDRKVGDDGVLRTNRVIATEWHIPSWVTKVIGLRNPSFSYEYSEVHPAERRMVLKSTNLNCTNVVSVDETLTYRPHPDDPQKTILEQSASISVKGIPLIHYMEDILASTINTNAAKGRQAMELVIGNIKKEYEGLSQKLFTEFNELTHQHHPATAANTA